MAVAGVRDAGFGAVSATTGGRVLGRGVDTTTAGADTEAGASRAGAVGPGDTEVDRGAVEATADGERVVGATMDGFGVEVIAGAGLPATRATGNAAPVSWVRRSLSLARLSAS